MMGKMPTRGWVPKETFHLCGVEGDEGDVVKKPISIGIPCVPNFKGVLSSIMRAFTSPIIIPKANGGHIFNKPTCSFVANVTSFAKTRPSPRNPFRGALIMKIFFLNFNAYVNIFYIMF